MHEFDYVIGVDGDGKNVLASEYFGSPEAFNVADKQEAEAQQTEFSADDPLDYVIAVDATGAPVTASEYYSNPTAFTVGEPVPPVAPKLPSAKPTPLKRA
jgi:hypothetical protein